MKSQRQLVIDTVRELGNRVTVADVVAKTGYSLEAVSGQLNTIAAETQATLEVDSFGEIQYCYPNGFAYIYLAAGLKRILLVIFSNFFKVLFFVFRISFGLMLLASLSVVFGTIIVFQSVMAALSGTTSSLTAMWGDFFTLISRVALTDLIAWNRSQDPDKDRPARESQNQISHQTPYQTQNRVRQGFLLNCYSFLFGESDPNGHIEEERSKLLAQVIRLNEGVVTAEHLAPYTGKTGDDEHELFKVLAKFNGCPVVSDTGNLIYVFPSMRQRSSNSSYGLIPPLLEEKPWRFSTLTKEAWRPVLGLAVGNFLGCLFFWYLCVFTRKELWHPSLFFFLALYSSLFLLVPLVRYLVIQTLNRRIQRRNHKVRQLEQEIGNPSSQLLKKLEDAEIVRLADNPFSNRQKKIVYSTNQDVLEQMIDGDRL